MQKKINPVFVIVTFVVINIMAVHTNTLKAQAPSINDRKFIEVTGSAEMSIEPDEVEISIVIQDSRANFDKREDELIEVCKKYKIPENQLSFKGNASDWSYWSYYWSYWWYYRNASELSQTYKIKVTSQTNLLDFAKDLNKPWVRKLSVTSTSNKDMPIYRKEVKKQAIRMAKEKAGYLLEAIDEKIGSVLSVEEIIADNAEKDKGSSGRRGYFDGYGWWDPYYGYGYSNAYTNNSNSNSNINMNSNSVMNSGSVSGTSSSEERGIEGIAKLKLRYEVKVKFEIK